MVRCDGVVDIARTRIIVKAEVARVGTNRAICWRVYDGAVTMDCFAERYLDDCDMLLLEDMHSSSDLSSRWYRCIY